MAITRVTTSSISATSSNASAYTVAIPHALLVGDLVIVTANSNGTHATNGISCVAQWDLTTLTTIAEAQQGNASVRWMQCFYTQVLVGVGPGAGLIEVTPYVGCTATTFVVDVFRGTLGLSTTQVTFSGPTGLTANTPALATAPTAGDLVLSLTSVSSGTATPPSPYLLGSQRTTGPTTSNAYVLAADGVSTYGGTWTWGTSNSSALLTVAFASDPNAAAPPDVVGQKRAVNRHPGKTPGKRARFRIDVSQRMAFSDPVPLAATLTLGQASETDTSAALTMARALSLSESAVWRGSSANGANALTTTVTIPATAQAGETAILAHSYNPALIGDTVISGGGTWLLASSQDWSASFRARVYWRVLGAGEGGTTITLTQPAGGSQKLAVALGVLGGVTGNPVLGAATETVISPIHPHAQVTTLTPSVQVAFITERESVPSTNFEAPAGFTQAAQFHNTGAGATSAGIAYNLVSVPAATTPAGSWVTDVPNDALVMFEAAFEVGPDAQEADTSASLSGSKTVALGQAVETDTSAALTATQQVGLGEPSETDTSFALTIHTDTVVVLGLATETDTASVVVLTKAPILGQIVETDTSSALATTKGAKTLGEPSETDTASAVALVKSKTAGLASETDTSSAVVATQQVLLGLAQEIDSSAALTVSAAKVLSQAAETDTAASVALARLLTVGLASEADTAQALAGFRTISLSMATETSSTSPLTSTKTDSLGQASESDSAFPLNSALAFPLAQAHETDDSASLTINFAGGFTLGFGDETSIGLPLLSTKAVTLGLATETDAAQDATGSKALTLSSAVETDTALSLVSDLLRVLGLAQETDSAHALSFGSAGRDIEVSASVEANRFESAVEDSEEALAIEAGQFDVTLPEAVNRFSVEVEPNHLAVS